MAKKKAAKKKTAAKKSAPSKRGKRYSSAMKRKVVDFVNKVNDEKGRGGAAAASRKFGVGQLTIGKWLKGLESAPTRTRTSGPKAKAARSKPATSSEFRKLADMDEQIAAKRAELEALETQFDQLKKKLLK